MSDVRQIPYEEEELDEELSDVLFAISVISRRLARKIKDKQEARDNEEKHDDVTE